MSLKAAVIAALRGRATHYECDNCGHFDTCETLVLEIADYDERVDPDGPYPDGECSECGCLSYRV